MHPQNHELLWKAGGQILHAMAWVYARLPSFWNLVSAVLVFGCLGLAVLYFRATQRVASWAWRFPLTYRRANGPLVAPVASALFWFGAAWAAPGYLPSGKIFRPGWWPSWGSIDSDWVTRTEPIILLCGFVSVATLFKRMSREKVIQSARGKAHFAEWSDVRYHPSWRWVIPVRVHYRGTAEYWGDSFLGGAGRALIALQEEECFRHVFLDGQTGSAKGFGVIGPILASAKLPCLVQDFKAECQGKELMEARTGLEAIRWGAAALDGWPSMAWNPLEEARRSPSPVDYFNFLSEILIPSRGESDWVADLSRPILAWIFARGGYQTLAEVHDDLVEYGVSKVLGKSGVPGGLLAALEGKNVKEYLGTTLFSSLASFSDGWGRKVTSGHNFSIDQVFARGGYVLSAESNEARRVPIVLFWRAVIRAIVSSNEKLNALLLFDEALAAGRIPDVTTVLETARSKNVGVLFGVQNLAGVRRVYGKDADSLLSTFATRIWLLNGMSPDDQEYLRGTLGSRVVEEKGANGKSERFLVDLMTRDEISRRANKHKEFWAVFDAQGGTHSGSKIVAKLVGVGGLTRRPSKEEQAADKAAQASAKQDPEQKFEATPDLTVQATVKEANSDEVAAARAAAGELSAMLRISGKDEWKVIRLPEAHDTPASVALNE